jgi:hypothetical protein
VPTPPVIFMTRPTTPFTILQHRYSLGLWLIDSFYSSAFYFLPNTRKSLHLGFNPCFQPQGQTTVFNVHYPFAQRDCRFETPHPYSLRLTFLYEIDGECTQQPRATKYAACESRSQEMQEFMILISIPLTQSDSSSASNGVVGGANNVFVARLAKADELNLGIKAESTRHCIIYCF